MVVYLIIICYEICQVSLISYRLKGLEGPLVKTVSDDDKHDCCEVMRYFFFRVLNLKLC